MLMCSLKYLDIWNILHLIMMQVWSHWLCFSVLWNKYSISSRIILLKDTVSEASNNTATVVWLAKECLQQYSHSAFTNVCLMFSILWLYFPFCSSYGVLSNKAGNVKVRIAPWYQLVWYNSSCTFIFWWYMLLWYWSQFEW